MEEVNKFKYGTYGYIAYKDLHRAQKNFEMGEYCVTGFYAQQCLEKIAKQYISEKIIGEDTSHYMKSHRLKKLYSRIPLARTIDNIEAVYSLTDCYFDNRYPGEDYFELKKEPASRYLKSTIQIFYEVSDMLFGDSEQTHEF